jgi:hypothetical protein
LTRLSRAPARRAFFLSWLLILCLSASPAFSQNNTKLEATISKSKSLPIADGLLTSGNMFEEKKISALFGGDEYHDNWYQIPSWLIHWWSPVKNEFGDGKLAQKEQDSLKGKGANYALVRHGFARYEDAKGQWWKWDTTGLWFVTDEGDRKTYIYGVEDKPKIVSESQWSRSTQTLEVVVDKTSGKVVDVSQHIREIKDTLLDTSPYTMKTVVTETVFDSKGNLTDKEEWTSTNSDAGQSKPSVAGKLKDGRRLHDLFIQYLKEHGMADRAPTEMP